jgi:glycosyltransferase involved in cell wall biosynthesis
VKIVFLAPFGIRPKGTLIARMLPLAAELQTLGHRVVIIAPPYTNPEDSGKVETVNGVMLRNIPLGPVRGAAGAPFLAWRMFHAARQERPDLVHLFKPKGYGGLAAMLHILLKRLGFRLPPLLVDCDDLEGRGGMNALHPYSLPERLLFDHQERWIPRCASGVTVASLALREMVLERGVGRERVFYLPNCASSASAADGAAVRQRFGIPPDAPVLLLYTRFFEFDQEKLSFLFSETFRRVPGVRFLVVGKGRNAEEERLQVAAGEQGFAPALHMAGWVSPEELPGCLAAGDAAVYPFADTPLNRAKCPAKLIELLQAGVPVVADRVGQIAEYLEDGVSGLLCDPADWTAMAEKTAMLLLDPRKGRGLGAGGARRIADHFSWPEHAARLARFYRAVMQR